MNRGGSRETDELRILFIARAFPPTVGGMENFAYQLSRNLRHYALVTPLINYRGKKALPFFLSYALGAATYLARRQRIDVVHLADALLAPLGAALKHTTGASVTASVCGLDVTYANRGYQQVIRRSLPRLDALMPISAATEAEVRARTTGDTRIATIPLGIDPPTLPSSGATREFAAMAGTDENQPVLLTVGRLVERKGVAWFTGNVLPRLQKHAIYVVVGTGPARETIIDAARAAGVEDRIRLLGHVDDGILSAAYARADVFVMPNVPVVGDMEGFGLVALEAAASGLPVVASRLEGITDALQDGRNASLVRALDAQAFAERISGLLDQPKQDRRAVGLGAAEYTVARFDWSVTARRYAEVMRLVVAQRGGTAEQVQPLSE